MLNCYSSIYCNSFSNSDLKSKSGGSSKRDLKSYFYRGSSNKFSSKLKNPSSNKLPALSRLLVSKSMPSNK